MLTKKACTTEIYESVCKRPLNTMPFSKLFNKLWQLGYVDAIILIWYSECFSNMIFLIWSKFLSKWLQQKVIIVGQYFFFWWPHSWLFLVPGREITMSITVAVVNLFWLLSTIIPYVRVFNNYPTFKCYF